ncbi:HPr family phosphocarrier protein [Pseudoroseomonas wenyumeiae]
MILSRERIRLGASPADKDAAIRQAAQLLVDTGAIEPGYAESMLRREGEADTFLGNGIAIPHGQRGDRGMIAQTGIAVLQVPSGVRWNGDDVAHLVVAIAAQGDEHIAMLRRLTEVLGEEQLARHLATTTDVAEILRALDPEAPLPQVGTATAAAVAEGGLTAEVQAPAAAGLHARPARAVTQIAKSFRSAISLSFEGRQADARSMIALLQLGAGPGARLTLAASGPDAAAAMVALRAAFAEGLGDNDATPAGPMDAPPPMPSRQLPAGPGTISGLPASPGVAVGVLHRFRSEAAGFAETATDAAAETAALDAALAATRSELQDVAREMTSRIGAKHAEIFAAHAEFLDDPELVAEAHAAIARALPPRLRGGTRPRLAPPPWRVWAMNCSPRAPST